MRASTGATNIAQIYDFCYPYWRVKSPDGDWNELPGKDQGRK